MGFFQLLEVSSMPVFEVLLVSLLGALLATKRFNLLPSDARKQINKLVFSVFTPCLMFASLAKTVTFQDIISWWFMPVNIGITFLLGGILGWVFVKILKLEPYLEGLVIASCSAGNLGNLLLIIVPAMCDEDGSPFGERSVCRSVGLSYASFSMALGGFYIWTHTYHLIRTSAKRHEALRVAGQSDADLKIPNKALDANAETNLLKSEDLVTSTNSFYGDIESKLIEPESPTEVSRTDKVRWWTKLYGSLHQILEELLAPPTVGAIVGFIFGSVPWLKRLIIGDGAPLHVIQDSIKLLGDGTIPCITLILGGNLTQGLRSSKLKSRVILGIVLIRFVLMPLIGIGIVKAAYGFGLLPSDPLFRFVLMVQFTLPPAMTISTMTQLFDVAQEECSVILLWSYIVAALALTSWSTVFMYVLS
ncbi:hypothetical protein Syun_005641 [Stephania yunnanensis]|uniref:Uncharacterized protein n=1 Tax=Stephania yunnanensis TaxID=152371 RepID=A0AAP0Q3M8_9MAGN